MDPTQWQHQQQQQPQHSGLQLEHEYDRDPAQFSVLQNDITQRFDGRQAPMQQTSYNAYSQPFTRANQQHFSFQNTPSQGMSVQYNNGFIFSDAGQSATAAAQQGAQPFAGVNNVYRGSAPSSVSQSTMGANVFREGVAPFHFQQAPIQSGSDVHVSQRSHTNPNLAVPASMHAYQSSEGNTASSMTQHLFPPIMTTSYSSSSSDLGAEQMGLGGASYMAPGGRLDTSPHGSKRARVPEEGYADDEGDDRGGESNWKEPAKTTEEAKHKMSVCNPIHQMNHISNHSIYRARACTRCRGLKVRDNASMFGLSN